MITRSPYSGFHPQTAYPKAQRAAVRFGEQTGEERTIPTETSFCTKTAVGAREPLTFSIDIPADIEIPEHAPKFWTLHVEGPTVEYTDSHGYKSHRATGAFEFINDKGETSNIWGWASFQPEAGKKTSATVTVIPKHGGPQSVYVSIYRGADRVMVRKLDVEVDGPIVTVPTSDPKVEPELQPSQDKPGRRFDPIGWFMSLVQRVRP